HPIGFFKHPNRSIAILCLRSIGQATSMKISCPSPPDWGCWPPSVAPISPGQPGIKTQQEGSPMKLKRRNLLRGVAGSLAAAPLAARGPARAAGQTTLTFVPQADLAILDPI